MLQPRKLPQQTVNIVKQSIVKELNAEVFKKACEAYAKNNGFDKMAAYYRNEAEDERKHAQKWIDYLTDYNEVFDMPIPDTTFKFSSFVEILEKDYVIENEYRDWYNKMYLSMHDNSDITTMNRALYFVDIQDSSVISCIDRLNLLNDVIGVDGKQPDKYQLLTLQDLLFTE